jgi:hypothetical protein
VLRKYASVQVLDAWRVASGTRSLRKAAHRVSFSYTPRPGYLYVRARAISSRCNDNWDAFPAGEIEKGYRTFLGKPCFVNHHNANHRRARGVIVAAALHRDRNPDGTPDTWVELLHEIDAVRFPKFAKAILSGRVNRTSMGVDCEYSTCSACGNRATSPAEYCAHMPGKKGMKFRKRGSDGRLREGIIHEICAGLTFFENSFLVEDPADPTAYVLDRPHLQATAARHRDAPGLLAHFTVTARDKPEPYIARLMRHITESHGIPDEVLPLLTSQKYQEHHGRPIHPPGVTDDEAPAGEKPADAFRRHMDTATSLGQAIEGIQLAHHELHGHDYRSEGGMTGTRHRHGYQDELTMREEHPYRPDSHRPGEEPRDPAYTSEEKPVLQTYPYRRPGEHGVPGYLTNREWKRDLHPDRTDEHPNIMAHQDPHDRDTWTNMSGCHQVYREHEQNVPPERPYPSSSTEEGRAEYARQRADDEEHHRFCPECGAYKYLHAQYRPSEVGRPKAEHWERARQEWDERVKGKTRPLIPNMPHMNSRTATGIDLPDATCPNCGSPRARAYSPMHETAQCSDCGTHYNHFTGRELDPDEVATAHAAQGNYEDYEDRRRAGEQLFSHFTEHYTHPMPGWDEAREWRDRAHREDLQPHPMSGTPLPKYPPRELGKPEVDEMRRRDYGQWAQRRREHAVHGWPLHQDLPVGPPRRETLSVLHHFQKAAITGEEAGPGHDIWAEPAEGSSPVAAELYHNMTHREPHSWYRGLSYHGPYHMIRHPVTRETHVVDAQGRNANPMGRSFGNHETNGSWGESQAQELWRGLESAGPDAHRIGTDQEPKFSELMSSRTPAFPHSRIDPQDTDRAQRPDARVHEPSGHSPEDEWHGPYEVVKHPQTGEFHVVDNAGRHAPGMGSYRGFPTQMHAERSRDYIDRRQQSKERAHGIVDKIWGGGMEVLDPGGTEESRQSEENTRRGSELMGRYAGGKGEIKFDPDEEGGAPYYHREITHENGRQTGWYVKHYGGSHATVYHHATGDEAHDEVHLPSDAAEHEYHHLPDDFDDIELGRHLRDWYHQSDGMRRHLEDQPWQHGGNERIRRWKQRRQGVRRQAAWAGQQAADADNAYAQTGCHHTSCGRSLHRHTAAGPDIIEERLHHPSDPAARPVRIAQQGARAYSSAMGLDDPHRESYGSIETNPDRIRRLAHAYHALPMDDPGAHAAFADMAAQVHRQYDHMTNRMGIRVEPVAHDPYANHLEMMDDLRNHGRLQVLKTASTGQHSFFDDDTNDKFRAVHDVFGHAATGRSFDRHGEEAAWLAHSRMFTGPARHAMTTETRGQNSMLISTGRFPPQKAALLPPGFLQRDAALTYPTPEDHPFFKANPVSSDNIKHAWLHHVMDGEKEQAHRWYPDAHLVSTAIGGGDSAFGAGMLSAYSPLTRWPLNLFNACRSIHEGRPLGTQKGDGAILPTHTAAARRLLAGEHHSQVFSSPTANKTRAFAHLIDHGGNKPEDLGTNRAVVCVDRHALSVAMGRRVTDAEFSAAPIGKRRYYNHVADKYRTAAQEISQETGTPIGPEVIQAGTWMSQQRRNEAEDATMRGRLGRGRTTRGRQDLERWTEHGRQHHPDLFGQTMHLGALQMMAADPPLRVPQSVDTLRPEACPVCGNSDVFKGQRCPVCGFVSPPDIFRDPDIDQARLNRQELEQGMEESPYPEGPADEQAQLAGQQIGSGEDADDQMFHPDQIAPDGIPGMQPEGAPGQGMLEPSGEDGQPADGEEPELDENGQPVEPEEEQLEGAQLAEEGQEEQDEGEQLGEQGTQGEAAEEGAEEEGLSPGKDQDEDERPGGRKMPKRSAAASAATAQDGAVAELRRENALLRHQLQFIAELAGVGPELDEIRRQADLANPGQPVPDPPQEPPVQSTEEALASGAPTGSGTGEHRGPGHSEDDPSRPGTTPGSLTAVPAEQTTTALQPGVTIPTPPANQLVDVTAPIQGTNPSQDGGVPVEQRRIETDVRVNPDPLKASGPGIGGAGNDGTAFPWTIAARQAVAGPPSAEDERGARTMASIRLARLRVTAGLARGDELEVGAAIEKDAALSLRDIEHEISTLSQVARTAAAQPQRYPRNLGPRQAARSAPSFAGSPQPVMAMTAGAVAGDSDDSDLFID